MTSVLIADDHEMIREGLRRVIEQDSSIHVAGYAASGAEALENARQLNPDVLLLDLVMPGRDGLEVIDELKRWNPGLRILVLSGLPEDQYALRCLRAGADGFLCKRSASTELLDAVRRVHRGGKYVSDEVATLLAVNVGKKHDGPVHEQLSDREFQVLRMIGAGNTVSEIARELNLSVKTVSTYRARILEKTDLRNNAEIIRYALQHDLTGASPPGLGGVSP